MEGEVGKGIPKKEITSLLLKRIFMTSHMTLSSASPLNNDLGLKIDFLLACRCRTAEEYKTRSIFTHLVFFTNF